jgi:NO-binding membrane sensor protein with MHYT domain
VTASIAAVWLAFRLGAETVTRRFALSLLAAVVMGLAITGMHYTGMAAANFDPAAICAVSSRYDVDNRHLAYVIAGTMLAILGLALGLPAVLSRRPA